MGYQVRGGDRKWKKVKPRVLTWVATAASTSKWDHMVARNQIMQRFQIISLFLQPLSLVTLGCLLKSHQQAIDSEPERRGLGLQLILSFFL